MISVRSIYSIYILDRHPRRVDLTMFVCPSVLRKLVSQFYSCR